MQKPFLKYSGNKFYCIDEIKKCLPDGKCLVEPFVGSGAVFLNTDYSHYFLADINKDLITVYVTLQQYGKEFIEYCKTLFVKETEPKDVYLALRGEFDATSDLFRKAALFVYLNRHAHGASICRYGLGGRSTASYGNRVDVKLPEKEMLDFYKKSKLAEFVVADYTDTLQFVMGEEVVYCDPPYVPLNKAYRSYHSEFNNAMHANLAETAERLAKEGVRVLISNHDCEYTRTLYQYASHLHFFQCKRKIGIKTKVPELIAKYS